jgi:hypothetical protein
LVKVNVVLESLVVRECECCGADGGCLVVYEEAGAELELFDPSARAYVTAEKSCHATLQIAWRMQSTPTNFGMYPCLVACPRSIRLCEVLQVCEVCGHYDDQRVSKASHLERHPPY